MDWWDILIAAFAVVTIPIWMPAVVYLGALAFSMLVLIGAMFAAGLVIVAMAIAAPFVWAARLCGIRKVSVKSGDLDRPRVYTKGTWRIK